MTATNRPIMSREYKLMLNTERFRDRKAGADLFWKLLAFLVENQGNEVIPDNADPDKDAEQRRTTWYLDTSGFELQRANVILRVREELDAKKRYKVTLKYRAPDRYTAAGCDVSCTQEVKDGDMKFEEDVAPPFASKFSNSVSFKTNDLPRLKTIADLVDLFPGLQQTGLTTTMPLAVVNGFQAHEGLHYLGKLRLDKLPTARGAGLPDFVVKVALNHWYLRADENDYPLVTEFSFGCDATTTDAKADRLAQFLHLLVPQQAQIQGDDDLARRGDGRTTRVGTRAIFGRQARLLGQRFQHHGGAGQGAVDAGGLIVGGGAPHAMIDADRRCDVAASHAQPAKALRCIHARHGRECERWRGRKFGKHRLFAVADLRAHAALLSAELASSFTGLLGSHTRLR